MGQEQGQAWANPGAWVLFSVGVLCACLGFILTGLVPETTVPLMIGVLLACALPQLLGGLIAFKRGEILLATIAGSFGTVVTLGAAFTMYIMVFAAPEPGAFTPDLLGPFWITLAIITGVFAICFGRMSWFMMLGVFCVGVAFLLLGLSYVVDMPGLTDIAGWLVLLFAAWCVYISAAILFGEHFQRPVLPIGSPVFK
ncbi:GPR1/FUN34/YaaH family transporter [Dehalococcoidia bacterium]|nr:GPR1/FUN34/YaaH family transporter [Dehalococcoidia bacterium]